MKKKKTNIKSFINANFFWIGLFVLIVFLVPILIISDKRQDRYPENLPEVTTPTISSDPFYIEVTPTILPSQRSGWKKFIHPQGYYNFEYPVTWNVKLNKDRYGDDWYNVYLNPNENNKAKIHFMAPGRGSPYYEYEKIYYKELNGKTVKWKLMYLNDEAFEAVASFPNSDFGEELYGLYIVLPHDNQEQFIHTIDEIIISMEKP